MSQPRLPLPERKRRHARLLLAGVTVVAVAGNAVTLASGRGVWTLGLVGWAAVVAAIWLGAGADNAWSIIGLRRTRSTDGATSGYDDRTDDGSAT